MKNLRILVLGSGVSGLTTAMTILQSTDHEVTLWSRESDGEFPSNSSDAFALWLPLREKADQRLEGWANYSLKVFKALAEIPDSGISLKPVVIFSDSKEKPWFAKEYAVARQAQAAELTEGYEGAWVLDPAPIIDPSGYLPWLRFNVAREGGKFVKKNIDSLDSFPSEFDVIINCTGLGSASLLKDSSLRPGRLQVVTVKNTIGLDRAYVDEVGPNKPAYVVPHGKFLKLGTVYDEDNQSTEVDEASTKDILTRCSSMVPELNFSLDDVVSVKRILCGMRDLVRMEPTQLADGRTLIHNYGHHRTGYITSHGIAKEIARLFGG